MGTDFDKPLGLVGGRAGEGNKTWGLDRCSCLLLDPLFLLLVLSQLLFAVRDVNGHTNGNC